MIPPTPLPPFEDVLLFEPDIFTDNRGSFTEVWNQRRDNLPHFVQLNQSVSKRGVLRGFHFQSPPFEQGKLVWVPCGEVLDAVVDIRIGSPTYGICAWTTLDERGGLRLWVPPGFAHAVQAIYEGTILNYLVTAPWSKEHEHTLIWRDSSVARIPWPHPTPILGEKDAKGKLLGELKADGVLPRA